MDQSKDKNIIRDLFAISLPKSFGTLQEQLAYNLSHAEDLDLSNPSRYLSEIINGLSPEEKEILGISGESPIPSEYLKQGKYRDTSLGGNDAINCYPQFHEDDDLVHPINSLDAYGNMGLGRAYEEKIDRNQQILWLSFGLPRFVDLSSFYLTSISQDLAIIMNKGSQEWNSFQVGYTLGKIVGFVATLPFKPFIYMYEFITKTFSDHANTKYIEFKPDMPLYYRIVNTQLAILAVNLGLTKPDKYFDESSDKVNQAFDLSKYKTQATELQQQLNKSQDEINQEVNQTFNNTSYNVPQENHVSDNLNEISDQGSIVNNNVLEHTNANGLPYLFSTYGLDILHILSKKDLYDKRQKVTDMKTLDEYLKELKSNKDGSVNIWRDVVSGFMSGTYESMAFVGFRIEKSTSSNESISNTTALPDIANTVNSKIQSVRSLKHNVANFNLGLGAIGNVVGGVADAIKGFVSGVLDEVHLSGVTSLLTGAGLIDFQEIWQDSSFSKSYNFTVKLRAISGDKVSIFYRYVILMLLLAGACPRSVGRNAYTSPFLVRAYCPGKFAVPLGIIDSMSITRGSDEFGWSVDGLPLNIDISFTIKDLSPAMFLGLADSTSWLDILGQNTSFSEYLMTLSGMSVQDRLLKMRNIKRRIEILLKIATTNKFNPMMWGFRISNNTVLGKLACAISPISKLPS